jgi:WD40 repeat protein
MRCRSLAIIAIAALAAAIVNGVAFAEVRPGQRTGIKFAVFSPDGRHIAAAAADSTVDIWDAATRKVVLTLKGHTSWVWSARYSPDGRRIVTASQDGTARIWDASTGRQLAVLKGHRAGVKSAVYSTDGSVIATASADTTARVWSADGRELAVLRGHKSWVLSARFSPDARSVVTASQDGKIRVFTAGSGNSYLEEPDGSPLLAALNGDGGSAGAACDENASPAPDTVAAVEDPVDNTRVSR